VDYLNYGKKYPEKMESLQNHSKNSAPRTVTDFSSCGQSFHGAMDDNKKYQWHTEHPTSTIVPVADWY